MVEPCICHTRHPSFRLTFRLLTPTFQVVSNLNNRKPRNKWWEDFNDYTDALDKRIYG